MKDDGVGLDVVDSVKDRLIKSGIDVIVSETDFDYCLSLIQPNDFLILVDAIYSGEKPGHVQIMTLNEVFGNQSPSLSFHEQSIIDGLVTYYPNLEGYLIGIEVAQISYGLELSEILNAEFNKICDKVFRLIFIINNQVNFSNKNI